jgi:AraC family transcriptional activator of pobA
MVNEEVYLFELAESRYGLVIAPMVASFVPVEDEVTAFDPHRHDTYGLFLLRSGELTIMVEGRKVVMPASSLLLVQPGQVHQCVQSVEIDGWVMFFDGKNLDIKTRAISEQQIAEVLLFALGSDELEFTDQLFRSVFQASENKNPGPLQTKLLHSLTNALFYHAVNLHLLLKSSAEISASRPAQIVHEFKGLIKASFKTLKKPAAYAALLHISVSHLNDTLKAHTGYSATHLIQQEVIGEAQKQLRYSSKMVKEIAINLGYSDHKYFIRLFTKIIGRSPSAFRKYIKSSPDLSTQLLVVKKNLSYPSTNTRHI